MSAIQAMRWPRSVGRQAMAFAPAQKTRAPRPYPPARESPLTRPCSSGLRGSSDGVSEKPKKTSAPMIPP